MTEKKKTGKGWTEERRRKQAAHCRKNKPWENATGPKTAAGKKRSSMNAYKHGNRATRRKYQKRIFLHHTKCLEAILAYDKIEIMKMTEKQSLIISRSKKAQNEVNELDSVIPTDRKGVEESDQIATGKIPRLRSG